MDKLSDLLPGKPVMNEVEILYPYGQFANIKVKVILPEEQTIDYTKCVIDILKEKIPYDKTIGVPQIKPESEDFDFNVAIQDIKKNSILEDTQKVKCGLCGADVWDNREKKRTGAFSAKSPDFSCKGKKGLDGKFVGCGAITYINEVAGLSHLSWYKSDKK